MITKRAKNLSAWYIFMASGVLINTSILATFFGQAHSCSQKAYFFTKMQMDKQTECILSDLNNSYRRVLALSDYNAHFMEFSWNFQKFVTLQRIWGLYRHFIRLCSPSSQCMGFGFGFGSGEPNPNPGTKSESKAFLGVRASGGRRGRLKRIKTD